MVRVHLDGGPLGGLDKDVLALPGPEERFFIPVPLSTSKPPAGPYELTGETYLDDRGRTVHVLRYVEH